MTRSRDALVATALAAVCATLYVVTLAPGLPHPSGDSHELTMAAAGLRLARRTGYPLFTWLGFLGTRLLPVGDVAFRTNATCALLAALGVAGLYFVARELRLRPVVAAFAALLLGFGTTYWSQAVLTEVYAVNVLLVTVQLKLLLSWARWRTPRLLTAFAFVFGLAPGTHMSNLGLAPAYAVFIVLIEPAVLRRPRTILAMLAASALGLAQFAWLPLLADTAPFPNPRPDTLRGFWDYTLGAFSELRFAFPLRELPNRLALALRFLTDNFTAVGVVVGMLGMWVLLARDAARWWLVFSVYLTNLVVSSQLLVFDLDVFFIAGYVAFALFVGFGVDAIGGVVGRSLPARPHRAAEAAVLAVALVVVARGSFADNDRRDDVAVDDFYRAAFDMLPRDSVLVAPSGVFSQGAAYYHDVLGLRPDVELLATPGAAPSRPEAPRYTTVGVARGALGPSSRWGLSPHALPPDAWFVPALVGARQDLVVWRVEAGPSTISSRPSSGQGEHRFAGATLNGSSIGSTAAGRVRVDTAWTPSSAAPVIVGTRIGGRTIESHELGFGSRARRGVEAARDRVVESFELVVPSTLPRGRHPLEVGVTRFDATGFSTEWLEIGHADVE